MSTAATIAFMVAMSFGYVIAGLALAYAYRALRDKDIAAAITAALFVLMAAPFVALVACFDPHDGLLTAVLAGGALVFAVLNVRKDKTA